MHKQLFKDTLLWGFLLWLAGYVLGIVLFMLVPLSVLGWVIMPFGIALTLWVLLTRVKAHAFGQFVLLAVVWTFLALVLDYFFLVKLFKPADGYYKLDVYLYYAFTFVLPLLVGWRKTQKKVAIS